MKLCDHHLHSEFSDDSETELTDIVEQALHLGMSEICITDHHDIDYPKDEEGHTFLLDTDRYISAVRKLQEQYKNNHEQDADVQKLCNIQQAQQKCDAVKDNLFFRKFNCIVVPIDYNGMLFDEEHGNQDSK